MNNTIIAGAGGENDAIYTIPVEGKVNGVAPAVVLMNPRYGHNVGNAMRACSLFGISHLWWTGERVTMELAERKVAKGRLPREERMKGWKSVQLFNHERPFDFFKNITPVCLEIVPGSQSLETFEHPENAVYIFGPEDGSVPNAVKHLCHRFITIPTEQDIEGRPMCLNLAAAVNVVLYDRQAKKLNATSWLHS